MFKRLVLFINKVLLSIFFIFLLFTGCAKTQEEKELGTKDKNITIKLEGSIYPSQKQEILALVPGRVKKVYVQNGDKVKKNDILYSLDKDLIHLAIEKKKSEIKLLEQIVNEMHKNGSNVEETNLAAVELKKMSTLQSNGYLNKFTLNQYKKNYVNALYSNKKEKQSNNENIKRQRIEINQKKLELKKLEFQYAHADSYAKIDGFVTNLDIAENKNISENQKLGLIQNIDNLILRAGFAKGLLPYIHKNTKVHISFLTTPPYTTEGITQRIVPIIDPDFDRMTVDIPLANKNYILQPSTRALVVLPLTKEEQKNVKKYFMGSSKDSVLEVRSKN